MQVVKLLGSSVVALAAASLLLAAAIPARADDTAAIQAQIDSASAAGGGTVTLEAHAYQAKTLTLKSNVTLVVPSGCVLTNDTLRTDPKVLTKNIAVKGSGTIQASFGYYAVYLQHVDGFSVTGVTVNKPDYSSNLNWTIRLDDSTNGTFDGVTVTSPPKVPETDGIDICNCVDITVENCHITTGDDGVSCKAFADKPTDCHDIKIVHNTFDEPYAGAAMGIGDENYMPIHDVTFSDNTVVSGTPHPYKLWGAYGGAIYNIHYKNNVGARTYLWLENNGEIHSVDMDGNSVLSSDGGVHSAGLSSGAYALTPLQEPGMRLDALGNGTADGTPVAIWKTDRAGDQKWILTQADRGSYKVSISYASNLCLTVPEGIDGDGTKLELRTDSGSTRQRWILSPSGGGYALKPEFSPDLAIVDLGSRKTSGARVGLWEANGNSDQIWSIKPD